MRMWLAWERMDRVLRTILLLLISILLLSPIVYCGVSDNWHDQQRILQLVVLSGSSLLLLFSFPLPFARRMVQVTLLVILGLGSVSAFLSANPSWAFKEWSVFSGLMLFSFNISVSPEWVRRAAIWGLVVLGGFFCYQFLLYEKVGGSIPLSGTSRNKKPRFGGAFYCLRFVQRVRRMDRSTALTSLVRVPMEM